MYKAVSFGLLLLPLLALSPGCAKKGDVAVPNGDQLGTRYGGGSEKSSDARGRGGEGASSPSGGAFEPAPTAPRDDAGRWEAEADFGADAIAREESRPGLGTAYGEDRRSSVETVGFRRAEPTTPDVVFSIRYDDVGGVRAAASQKRTRAFSDDALQQHAGLSFALLDDRGDVLPAASVGSELWAVGHPDARYSLAIANDTSSAFEVVTSVDGLDVIDGRPANFSKRGYIVDPFSSVVIDGWRTSEDSVAAFRFSSIDDSYAERMGDGRNVGVIGAAFFREAPRAWEAWRAPEETWRRDRADPFPGR
jgi:hypothetical protein